MIKKIIAFAGLPLSGKTTLSKRLANQLDICRIDVDEVRRIFFGQNSTDSEEDRGTDRLQLVLAWKRLSELVVDVLETESTVIVVGTFSRDSYHQRLFDVARETGASLKVIYCYAPDDVIERRILSRLEDENEPSNLKSMVGYNRVRDRYVKIETSDLLDVDTSMLVNYNMPRIISFVR